MLEAGRRHDRDPVLLVGFSEDRAEALAGEFAVRGFDVVRLDTEPECRDWLEKHDVAGVVASDDLPETPGVGLLETVRASYPTLPIVLDTPTESDHAGDVIAEGLTMCAQQQRTRPEELVDRFQESVDVAGRTAAQEVEERYRNLLACSPAPINIFDEDGTTVWGNDAVLDLLGLSSRDELVGRSIFEFVHPDYHELAKRELADVTEESRPIGPTYMQLVRDDGETRDVWVSTAPGTFEGEPIGQAVVVDITPLRDAHEAMRAEREFVQNAIDTLDDVFYVLGADGEIVRWNDVALDITGYTPAEMVAMDIEDVFVPADRDRIRRSFDTVLAEGYDAVEADVLTADGRTIPFEFRGRRLTDDDGEVVGIVGIGRDVSARVERERHLCVLERLLRHNIRTNMNVILGKAEMIESDDGDVSEAVATIESKGWTLLEMADTERKIVGLLTDPPEPMTVGLDEVLERSVATIRERYPAATVELADPPPTPVRAIPDIELGIEELLENGVDHGDADPPYVSIDTRREDGWIEVRVRDNGPGIPETEKQILASDREIDPLNHCSGLGLWYVYWVVRLSGGTIRFPKNPERGSTVVVRLRTAARSGDG